MNESILIPLAKSHAKELFPMVYKTPVVNTIQWDGPKSFEEFEAGLEEGEVFMKEGKILPGKSHWNKGRSGHHGVWI